MQWKKISKAETVSAYVFEKTGQTKSDFLKCVNINYNFLRFHEVKGMIANAVATKRKITLVADYDSDGINSAGIMGFLFIALGANFEIIMPKRYSEGYGLSMKIIERIADGNLLITIDNGIAAIEPIKVAKERGMDVIILDHHQAGDELPCADIIIDPSAIGEADYHEYCGAGIAYRLAEYILEKNHPFLPAMSAFSAIGTIGDCVPLTGDNRKIVIEGMQALRNNNCPLGMRRLCESANITENSTATDIAFNLVPILNAPGRLYDDGAKMALNAIFKNNPYDITLQSAISELVQINETRKSMVAEYMKRLNLDELRDNEDNAIFITDDILLGLVGIVAGRVAEHTNKSVFAFTELEGGLLKGSVRNPDDRFSVIEVIRKHTDKLAGCGGHKAAAGVSCTKENYEAFKNAICTSVPTPLKKDYIPYDLDVPEALVPMVAQEILSLEPFGQDFPAPVVRIKARLYPQPNGAMYRILKNVHAKFTCRGFDAIAFNCIDKIPKDFTPTEIDMIGTIGENVYKGKRIIQILVTDFVLS